MVNLDKQTLDNYRYWRQFDIKPKWALERAKAERRAWELGLEVYWDWDDCYDDDSHDDYCPDYLRWKAGYTDGRSREKWYYRKLGYTKQENQEARTGEHYQTRKPDCNHTSEYGIVKSPLSGETLASCGGFMDLDHEWLGDYRFYRRDAEVDLLMEALDEYDKELRDSVYYLGDPIESPDYQEEI